MGHYLGLVTFDKAEADTKEDAIMYADSFLEREGFCYQSFFARGVCDYFSVGLPWLAANILGAEHGTREFDSIFFNEMDTKDTCMPQKIQAMYYLGKFYEKFKKSPPYIPVSAFIDGNDSASIVTRNIYENLLVKYLGTDRDDEEFWDLDFECVDESFIGRKWIVAIDYHI